MCDTKSYGQFEGTATCCCSEIEAPPFFRHHRSHFRPFFPSRKKQVEILKEYKQKLQEEINEIEKRLKELE